MKHCSNCRNQACRDQISRRLYNMANSGLSLKLKDLSAPDFYRACKRVIGKRCQNFVSSKV